jgi:hypothetical protein
MNNSTHDAMRVNPCTSVHGGYLYAFLSCDLGQAQLHRCSYGSVHSRLHNSHLKKIVIPLPDDGGKHIGELVDRSFNLSTKGSQIEQSGIDLFLNVIHQGREATEAEWGREQ